MVTLILIAVFFIVAFISWFMGLWSNMITLMVLTLSGLIATNYYEPLAAWLDKPVIGGPAAINVMGEYTYLLDFIAFWAILLICLLLFRGLTDLLSRHRVRFNQWVELAGRSVLAIWVAWLFVCLVAFSLQLSPLPAGAVQASPSGRMMLIGPDRIWLGFMQSRSRGALARGKFTELPRHEDDAEKNTEPFDSNADLIYKYRSRRDTLDSVPGIRVPR